MKLNIFRVCIAPKMSASLWDHSPASAGSLLTNEECFILLDADIEQLFNNNDGTYCGRLPHGKS